MTESDFFRNKVVWITGASSGIGEALAYRLNGARAKLVLSSHEPEELARVKAACRNADSEIMLLPLDLAKSNEMPAMAGEVLARFGKVDILVNNGGISQRSFAIETDFELDRKIMEIDYFGHVALTKAVLPSMVRNKAGHIVVTTSVMGKIGAPLRTAYCAAKHALHGFFDALRAEVWSHNISILLICPAAVRTSISINALDHTGRKTGRMDKVIEQGISPEECAASIARAVVSGKREVILGRGKGILLVYLGRYLPGVYSRLIRKLSVT